MGIAPKIEDAARHATETLMREIKGIKAALISTEDGFEVASQVSNTAQVSRLAAMASSLAALGALAGEESHLGSCGSLVMEAAEGYIAMVQVHRVDVTLIMSVVAGRDAIIGQVLYISKQTASALEKI